MEEKTTRESAESPLQFPELARKLSALIRFKTVSSYIREEEDGTAFMAFRDSLGSLYPLVHSRMRREFPSDRSILYTWMGSEPTLEPVILCAHYDVVPPVNPENWTHDPFSGDIADGSVWGRGAQDIKVLLASALEAAEALLAREFMPRRTIYFAFGGDEEIGGAHGASEIASVLEKRGVRASFLLDEGGPISVGMLDFAQRPLALVGVAEKGYVDLLLQAKSQGGHASMPPKHSATGDIARAVAKIENSPPPARLTRTIRAFLSHLAPNSAQPYRFLFENLWLTAPLIKLAFGASPTTNALIRTTFAPTMLKGSAKENVLADVAEATVNVRILPGETCAEVLDRIGKLVESFKVTATIKHAGHAFEPSAESETDHEGWRSIGSALSIAHPEAACIPFLFSAGTDTKHYKHIAGAMYRFTALPQSQADLKGVHGENEKVRISDLDRCGVFYRELLAGL